MLALTATGALIAGCGTSDAASSAPADPNAINLHAADEARFGPFGPGVEKCDGGWVDARESLLFESQAFVNRDDGGPSDLIYGDSSHPIWEVRSAVYMMRNAALAVRRVRLAGSTLARVCLKHFKEADSRRPVGSGGTNEPFIHKVEVSALPSPLPGVPVYGMRSRACFGLFSACD
jgi:hypothetical protein